MAQRRPFWESTYLDLDAETFGPASEEVAEVCAALPEGALALDIGCGDGRNAICMAERGLDVHAFDVSFAGVAKCRSRAGARGVPMRAWVQDVGTFVFSSDYDLVVAHGVLHLLERSVWQHLLESMQRHTRVGGWNIVAVFTERLPPPEDLAPHMKGLFQEGELRALYAEWTVARWEAYTLHDHHPGGISHQHPINKIVAHKQR